MKTNHLKILKGGGSEEEKKLKKRLKTLGDLSRKLGTDESDIEGMDVTELLENVLRCPHYMEFIKGIAMIESKTFKKIFEGLYPDADYERTVDDMLRDRSVLAFQPPNGTKYFLYINRSDE